MASKSKTPASPGTKAFDRLRGIVRPEPKLIDRNFVSDSRGGQYLQAGRGGVAVRDNRTKTKR